MRIKAVPGFAVVSSMFFTACPLRPAPPPPPPPPPSPVQVVVQSESLNANGVNILLAYETASPLILAHVQETQELKDPTTNSVVRTVNLEFWEWFTPQMLPAGAQKPPNMPQGEWNAIAPLRGQTIVLSDRLQTGPFLVTGLGPYPDPFHVTITRTHTFFTGAQLQGQGQGAGLDLGRFGYLQTDANGGNPSMTQTDMGPPAVNTDLTPQWRRNKAIQGRVVNAGTQQATVTILYQSAWQSDPAAAGTFGVDWRIQIDMTGAARRVVTGNDSGKRPSDLP
jgi:hypothetical protein